MPSRHINGSMFKTYRGLLKFSERMLYDTLAKGIKKHQKCITVFAKNIETISKCFEYVKLDNPLFYYTDAFKTISAEKAPYTCVLPQYQYDEIHRREIDEKANRLGENARCVISKTEDYEKVVLIHDFICRNIEYKNNGDVSHNIVGCVVYGKAVCDGIAMLFKYLCDLFNIPCVVVMGKARRSRADCIYDNHAWNKVMIEQDWYNVDVTFDLTIGSRNNVRHDYLLVTDAGIASTHQCRCDYGAQIVCKQSRYNYYIVNNLIMPTPTVFFEYFKKEYANGKRAFEIKIPNGSASKELEHIIVNSILLAVGESIIVETRINYDLLVVGIIVK